MICTEEAKNDFQIGYFKMIRNAVFGRIIDNVRKHRYTKLVTTKARKKYLVLQQNYHRKKYF